MHMITDQLLVGNIADAQQPPAVVGTLLLVAEEVAVTPAPWMDYRHIPFREFAKAWLESRAPTERKLVCCRAGMGRSVSVVMAYLCCVEGKSYNEVLKLVMIRHPGAMPLPNLQVAIEQVRQLRRSKASCQAGS